MANEYVGVAIGFSPAMSVLPIGLARAATREVEKKDLIFRIDQVGSRPHVTLFQMMVATECLPDVRMAFSELVVSLTQFSLGPITAPGSGYLFWDVVARDVADLRKAHGKVVAALKELRDPFHCVSQYVGFTPTSEQAAAESETGYPLAGALFRPHITLARFREYATAERVAGAMRRSDDAVVPGEIMLVRHGAHGEIREVLRSYPFTRR